MKKLFILALSLAAIIPLHAQWVNDPANNTLLANASSFGTEIYLSTNEVTGDTYVQWNSGGSNGWGPTLQRLTFDGTPQWGADGIRITSHEFSSSSEGVAMCATTDDAVVSCFANYDGQTVAVKINSDGSYAWGEQGVNLFDGQAFSRAEVIAGDDGGVWALGFDYHKLYLQNIKADGGLYPTITIEATGYNVQYGQMTLGVGNSVFLTYEKCGTSGFYTDKEMYVVGYTREGVQIGPEVQLMASQTFQVTYLHHVVPDGMGGGYAYIWHSGIGGVFNTYVFHYDANGATTIHNPDGTAVHSEDPANLYLDAYATVDPVSHDIIIAYIQVDSYIQSNDRILVNRITPTGEKLWGDGIMVADYLGVPYGNLRVDAFEDGSGFTLVYEKASANNDFNSTVEAIGFDMECNQIWSKTLCTTTYNRSMCENTAGFHLGQNIVAWVNSVDGGLYGQNIGPDGTMGHIDPVYPVECLAPQNFDGEYVYNEEDQTFGALLTWEAPETQPLWYQLEITMPDENIIIAEIDPTETEYFHEMTVGALMIYRLKAVYEYCESEYALTPTGSDYVVVDVTGIPENMDEEIVTVTKVYTLNGQLLHQVDTETLSNGVYIIQGLTRNGNITTKKMVINR